MLTHSGGEGSALHMPCSAHLAYPCRAPSVPSHGEASPPRASMAARCALRRARRPWFLPALPAPPPPPATKSSSSSQPPPPPRPPLPRPPLGPLRAGAPPLLRRTVVSPGPRGRGGGVEAGSSAGLRVPAVLGVPAARGPPRAAGVAGGAGGDRDAGDAASGERPAVPLGPAPAPDDSPFALAAALPLTGRAGGAGRACAAQTLLSHLTLHAKCCTCARDDAHAYQRHPAKPCEVLCSAGNRNIESWEGAMTTWTS